METVKIALETGDKHYNNGREKEALQSYIKAFKIIRKLQESSEILCENICHAYFVSVLRICDIIKITGDQSKLIKIYHHLLLTPSNKLVDNMICCERIGDVYFEIGDYNEALICYEKQNAFALIADDEQKDSFYFIRSRILSFERIGQTLYKLKRYDEAMDNFKEANRYIEDGIRTGGHPLMLETSAVLKNIKATKAMIERHNQALVNAY